MPRQELTRLMEADPEYFYTLAPCALALGVIRPYADAFARRPMEPCPYLLAAVKGQPDAQEWGQLMADTADRMDARARKLMIEKWVPTQLRPANASRPQPRKRRQQP